MRNTSHAHSKANLKQLHRNEKISRNFAMQRDNKSKKHMTSKQPLAERMRPIDLEHFVGQEHLTGKGKILRRVIAQRHCPSLIFWGPPGTGKTTLAHIIAKNMDMPFRTLSAVDAGVKQVREIIAYAKQSGKTLLFIDEIHRFSKSQQDSLLGAVEKGTITLIGATTENPSFEVIPALQSRCQVYVLKELGKEGLLKILQNAITADAILQQKNIKLEETDALLQLSGGDARRLLNNFEMLALSANAEGEIVINNAFVERYAQEQMLRYDKGGDQHYDIISAFIKSIRGSDPNAAVYWLARMIAGGEDPKFIARRLLILASEDIGNANPTALVLANACFDAVQKIGYPECDLILSQTTIYLATSTKSNASYLAIKKAKAAVGKTGNLPVPLHIRNAPTRLMKSLDYGLGYRYAHDFANNFVNQEYLPEKLMGTTFYKPGKNAREEDMRKRLRFWWKHKYGY